MIKIATISFKEIEEKKKSIKTSRNKKEHRTTNDKQRFELIKRILDTEDIDLFAFTGSTVDNFETVEKIAKLTKDKEFYILLECGLGLENINKYVGYYYIHKERILNKNDRLLEKFSELRDNTKKNTNESKKLVQNLLNEFNKPKYRIHTINNKKIGLLICGEISFIKKYESKYPNYRFKELDYNDLLDCNILLNLGHYMFQGRSSVKLNHNFLSTQNKSLVSIFSSNSGIELSNAQNFAYKNGDLFEGKEIIGNNQEYLIKIYNIE